MIPNITRGGKTHGVLAYLLGPGRAEEHTNPIVVGGSILGAIDNLEVGDRLEPRDVTWLTEWLDAPMRAYEKNVMRKLNEQGELDKAGKRQAAHVWHCSLSLHPSELDRNPQEWQQVADRYLELMTFGADATHGAGRTIAVNHGVSEDGRGHIHIVANVVTDDGRQWNEHDDFRRSQRACSVLAHEFDLRLVDGQEQGRGQRGYKKGELESDRRRGGDVGDLVRITDSQSRVSPRTARPQNGTRRRLEQIVSSCATAASDEREFVALLREFHGVVAFPRYATGGAGVTGYKIGFRTNGDGQKLVTYAGGKLGRDLTLPALRAGWEPLSEAETVDAWRRPRERTKTVPGPELLTQAETELADLRKQLMAVDVSDRRAWSAAARDAAGVLNSWSLRTEPEAGPLAEAAYALRASATIHRVAGDRGRWLSRRAARVTSNALLFHKPARTSVELARQVSYMTRQLVEMHSLDQQRERAHELEMTALRSMVDLEQRLSPTPRQEPTEARPRPESRQVDRDDRDR